MKIAMAAAAVWCAGLGALLGTAGVGLGAAPAAAVASVGDEKDRLILSNGQIIEGVLISETADTVKFRVIVAGISSETEYKRSDIVAIERAARAGDPAPAAAPKAGAAAAAPAGDGLDPSLKKKVYFIELKGWFGTEIFMPPLKAAVADAKKFEPDYLVVIVDNAWERFEGLEKKKSDENDFYGMMLAREMDPILTDQIRNEWDKQPRLVFWVKKAMGGAAFLPFLSRDVYFTSTGRMGGIGGVDILYGTMGDEVVRDKMVSLLTATARGLAIKGGHNSRIARAMCELEYVLSARFPGGEPVYYERYAEPGEVLLTDNGLREEDVDSVEARVSGEGNDVLTLDANTALLLGVSKGTADDEAALLEELGISRNAEVTSGRSKEIFEAWREGVNTYGRKLRTLLRELEEAAEVQAPGGYNERKAARGRQIAKIGEILAHLEKYGACVRYDIEDPGVDGDPEQLAMQLRLQRSALQLQQMLDKR